MGGGILIFIDIFKELKAIIILLFCVLAPIFVKDCSMTILFVIISIFLIGLSFYIKANNLIISKNIFYLIIASLNVFTLLFVIQYLIEGEVSSILLKKVFGVFIGIENSLFYVGWLLLLTSGLIILEKLGGGKSGREKN